jgi:hypothetical protein
MEIRTRNFLWAFTLGVTTQNPKKIKIKIPFTLKITTRKLVNIK